MLRIWAALMVMGLLSGCAQPRPEKPMANGAYLVIDQGQAWAVLIANGKRIEERGELLDVQYLPGPHSQIAASYVVETTSCGRLQWLTQRLEDDEQATRLLAIAQHDSCAIADGLTRDWTALDYSG